MSLITRVWCMNVAPCKQLQPNARVDLVVATIINVIINGDTIMALDMPADKQTANMMTRSIMRRAVTSVLMPNGDTNKQQMTYGCIIHHLNMLLIFIAVRNQTL